MPYFPPPSGGGSAIPYDAGLQRVLADGGYSFASDPDTLLARTGTNQIGLTTAGTYTWTFDALGRLVLAGDGTAAGPAVQLASEASGLYLAAAGVLGLSVAGAGRLTLANLALTFQDDTDAVTILGRARIDSRGSDIAYFSHRDSSNTTAYALRQTSSGSTVVNAPAGQDVRITNANGSVTAIIVNGTGMGFFGTAPVAKQSIAGSRGGNAALADLLTKLAATGLITDATTA